jgi:hypothetical protein
LCFPYTGVNSPHRLARSFVICRPRFVPAGGLARAGSGRQVRNLPAMEMPEVRAQEKVPPRTCELSRGEAEDPACCLTNNSRTAAPDAQR